MEMLYAKAAAHNNHCLFVEFPTGMHMDTWLAGGDHYWQTIQQFLQQHAPEEKENRSSGNENGNSLLHAVLLKWIKSNAKYTYFISKIVIQYLACHNLI